MKSLKVFHSSSLLLKAGTAKSSLGVQAFVHLCSVLWFLMLQSLVGRS